MGKQPHLAHPRYPGDHQLEDKLVFHRYLCEEEVDFVVPTLGALWGLSNHIGIDKAGLCRKETPGDPQPPPKESRHPLHTEKVLGTSLNLWRDPGISLNMPRSSGMSLYTLPARHGGCMCYAPNKLQCPE